MAFDIKFNIEAAPYLCQFDCRLEMRDGTDQHVIRYQTSFSQGHIRLVVHIQEKQQQQVVKCP